MASEQRIRSRKCRRRLATQTSGRVEVAVASGYIPAENRRQTARQIPSRAPQPTRRPGGRRQHPRADHDGIPAALSCLRQRAHRGSPAPTRPQAARVRRSGHPSPECLRLVRPPRPGHLHPLRTRPGRNHEVATGAGRPRSQYRLLTLSGPLRLGQSKKRFAP